MAPPSPDARGSRRLLRRAARLAEKICLPIYIYISIAFSCVMRSAPINPDDHAYLWGKGTPRSMMTSSSWSTSGARRHERMVIELADITGTLHRFELVRSVASAEQAAKVFDRGRKSNLMACFPGRKAQESRRTTSDQLWTSLEEAGFCSLRRKASEANMEPPQPGTQCVIKWS